MFHDIPAAVLARMAYLEDLDARDREDGTPRMQRLRQIPPEVGRFIALLAACAPAGPWIEVGASGGYSALWLALACRLRAARLTTFELLPDKARLARQTLRLAGVEDVVALVEGDARAHLPHYQGIGFCFLDAEKEVYAECAGLIIPRLAAGGLLVADNAINHQATLQPMLDAALGDPRIDALVVPIGKGELVCRKL